MAVVVVAAVGVAESTSKAVDAVVIMVAEAMVVFFLTMDTILQMAMAPIPKHPHNIINNNNNKAHNS
jgi:mevalonate kinase